MRWMIAVCCVLQIYTNLHFGDYLAMFQHGHCTGIAFPCIDASLLGNCITEGSGV